MFPTTRQKTSDAEFENLHWTGDAVLIYELDSYTHYLMYYASLTHILYPLPFSKVAPPSSTGRSLSRPFTTSTLHPILQPSRNTSSEVGDDRTDEKLTMTMDHTDFG